MNWLVLLQLVILSEGIAAFIGAISAWRMTDAEGRKVSFFLVCSFALMMIAVGSFGNAYNSIVNGPRDFGYPPGFLQKAIAFRLFYTIGVWVFALRMFGGDGGIVKKVTQVLIDKFQGKRQAPLERAGEMPREYYDERFQRIEDKIDRLRK